MTALLPTNDAEAQVRVTNKYDSSACSYDKHRQGPFFDLASDVLKCLVGSIKGLRILDVPVGTGRAMPILVRSDGKPESYLGVDIAPNMLKVAKEKARALGIADYVSIQGRL